MICPNCHRDVEGIWVDAGTLRYPTMQFECEGCGQVLETEDSYEDYVSDMKEEAGRGRYKDDF